MNITTNTADKVNSGELVPNPNINLDNTVWKGSYNSYPYQLNFLSGVTLKEKIDTDNFGPYYYIRGASGGYIRYKYQGTYNAFGVITTTGEMKGCVLNANYFWNLKKQ